jgi:catalase
VQADAGPIVRSMALRILTPGGGEWRTGMNNIPVFPANSAQGFYDQLVAARPDPATGKPDPAAMQAFLARHPEAARALTLIKARVVSSGFGDSTFNSLNAFRLVSGSGVATGVRWAMVPVQAAVGDVAGDAASVPAPAGEANGQAAAAGAPAPNYLFDDLITELRHHPLQWHLVVTVARPIDATSDATVPWPEDRQHIDAGTLTLNSVSSEDGGPCTDINYDPLVLPPGIAPSDDPLLSARSAAYSRSFTLRASEKSRKPPSQVTPQEVRGGQAP